MISQTSLHPAGMTAISRWSRSAPPEHGDTRDTIPEGSQTDALSCLRDECNAGDGRPVVALRLPPANGLDPFGVKTN